MSNPKKNNLKLLFIASLLMLTTAHAKTAELPRSEMFILEDAKYIPLYGKIINGRYHSPKKVFSCKADDFGEGEYISQDALFDDGACVAFYNSVANFKKAEIIFAPGLINKNLNDKALRDIFDRFGIGILKEVDNAQGIEILKEEVVNDNMVFVAISIEKMSVLEAPGGQHPSSTRGYLVFQEKDKLVVLTNQEVTLPGERHTPKNHIEKLKKDILDFKKTFEFGSIPDTVPIKKTEAPNS